MLQTPSQGLIRHKVLQRLAAEALSSSSSSPSAPSSSPSPSPSSAESRASSRAVTWSPSPTPDGNKAKKLMWSTTMLEALLEALSDQADAGHRADNKFKPEAWTYARDKVAEVATELVTVKQVKDKYDSCKKEYRIWSELLRQSGFSYEDGRVVADAPVLDSYFHAHKEARKYRRRPLDFPELHEKLFEGYSATGEDATTIDDFLETQSEPATSVEDDFSMETSGSEASGGRRKRAGTRLLRNQEKRAKNKTTSEERMGQRIDHLTSAISELVAVNSRDYQQDAIVQFIEAYQSLDDRLKYPILEGFKDEFDAKVFLSMKSRSAQKAWIKHRCNVILNSTAFDNKETLRDELQEKIESLEWVGDGELSVKIDKKSSTSCQD